jgi:hypothetical protein
MKGPTMSYSPTLAVIHTSPATVDLFKGLLRARLPQLSVMNLLDDSILPQLASDPAGLAAVRPRWEGMARTAKSLGVRAILNACSSIGEFCEPVAQAISLPIVRVDARMARQIASKCGDTAVVATLRTTLEPTARLLRRAFAEAGTEGAVTDSLADGAYAALMAGRPDEHDRLVRDAIIAAAGRARHVVLAQASMARVLSSVPEELAARCIASPPLAVEDVAEALHEAGATRPN